jgi:phosphoglycerol geranylgeranyltransferase
MNGILAHIRSLRQRGKKAFAVLVDPDKLSLQDVPAFCQRMNSAGIDLIFVGGSLLMGSDIHALIGALKVQAQAPVILFPGNLMQLSNEADAILFLSLISGRNADLLIGNHVLAAPFLKNSDVEVIPTGYMLIDTGKTTTVHYMSNTQPIPFDKPDIAAATAMAGQLLGLQLIYLEGGSGGECHVSAKMISAVAAAVDVPVIVGGGIRDISHAEEVLRAGADVVVVGNALEDPARNNLLFDIPKLIASL